MPTRETIDEAVTRILRTPSDDPQGGFAALDADGSTKPGFSEQVLAAMARAALTKSIEGVVFNEITAHRDETGQLMRIEVEFMDQVHDPSPQKVTVAYEAG